MPLILTGGDHKALVAVFQSFESELPKINYEKMRQLLGSESIHSMQSKWCNLKKKIFAGADAGAASGKGRGRKRKAEVLEEGDGEEHNGDMDEQPKDSASPAPTKKTKKSTSAGTSTRKPKSRSNKVPAPLPASDDDDEDEDELLHPQVPPRPIKRNRKPKHTAASPAPVTAAGQEKKTPNPDFFNDDGAEADEETAAVGTGAGSRDGKGKEKKQGKEVEVKVEEEMDAEVTGEEGDEEDVGGDFLAELNAYARRAGSS